MAVQVQRESDTTKARFVVPTYIDKDGNSFLTSSDKPFPTIDVNHLRLHEGRAFYLYKVYPYSAGLAAGSSAEIAIAWPAGITPHLVFTYSSPGEAEFYVYENPTTSSGTPMTIFKRNRVTTTTSTAAAVIGPTVSAAGTEIYAEIIPAGNKGGGGESYSHEFVLKSLTTYLFKFTNTNEQTHPAIIRLDWYE